MAGQRPPSPAVATSQRVLHLGLLGDLQCIVNLDAKIPNGAFQLLVPKQEFRLSRNGANPEVTVIVTRVVVRIWRDVSGGTRGWVGRTAVTLRPPLRIPREAALCAGARRVVDHGDLRVGSLAREAKFHPGEIVKLARRVGGRPL